MNWLKDVRDSLVVARLWMAAQLGGLLYNLNRVGLYRKGTYSTGIHGGMTYGYGKCDHNGFWQFPVWSMED